MVGAVERLAWRWFRACSVIETVRRPDGTTEEHVLTGQNLVLLDSSLPRGGVLDVGRDWTPTNAAESKAGSAGHWRHRDGIEVDISKLSIPPSGRCGPSPAGPMDPTWFETLFFLDGRQILRDEGLDVPFRGQTPSGKVDLNHLLLLR